MVGFDVLPVIVNGATVLCCLLRKGVTAFSIMALKPDVVSANFPLVRKVPRMLTVFASRL